MSRLTQRVKGRRFGGIEHPHTVITSTQNTCYVYTTGDLAKTGTLTGDAEHLTGCVNGKTLESGCTQE
jgi:hypothetical protein